MKSKHLLIFLTSLIWGILATQLQGQDLIITGVYDGPLTGGTPKGVELYVVNNIADLSIYGLGSANNGGGSDGEEFTFPAVAATAGDFIYVSSEATQFANWFGFAPDYTDGAMSINGDDAIELFMNSTVVDLFGDINTDGTGESWEYLDGWAYRVNGTGPDATFTDTDWTYSSPNALAGETTNGTAVTPFPIGTYTPSAVVNPEPTSHVTGFTATTNSATEIELTWTDAIGADLADGYLIVARDGAGTFAAVADGTPVAGDTDFSDNEGEGNKADVGGANSFSFTTLDPGTQYFFEIYPYANSGANIDYKTNGTVPSASATTEPATPASLDNNCTTPTSVVLSWPAASGNFDGYLLVARQSTNEPAVVNGNIATPGTQTFDTDFSAATVYDGGTDSRVVYRGTATTITISGLTAGLDYTFELYTYLGTQFSGSGANGPTASAIPAILEVQNLLATPENEGAILNWSSLDASCFDDVLVVGKAGSSVTNTPTLMSYSGSNAFGLGDDLGGSEYVIYQGTANQTAVAGLTNGVTYYLKVFVRVGGTWSTGVEVSVVPSDVVNFQQGDLAIVAVNANNGACSGNSGEDVVYFVAFEDIEVGTTFDITDNGWERVNANEFGDTEGILRFTRSGATIPAGTIFSIIFGQNLTETSTANPDWSIGSVSGGLTNVNLNSGGDQFFVMQGGTWNDPAGTHNADYIGKFFFGFNTQATWAADGSTQQSNLHPAVECAHVEPGVGTDYFYYDGPVSATSPSDWFDRFRDNSNWASATGCVDFNSNFTLTAITLNTGVATTATWTGAVDDNWFNCQNWDILRVPGQTVDVIIPTSASTDCVIDHTAAFAENFDYVARCNNIDIQSTDDALVIEATLDALFVYGNLSIADGATLDMNGGLTGGGLQLRGNWTDNSTGGADGFDEGLFSIVLMNGTSAQTISDNSTETFANLAFDNSAGFILQTDVQVATTLTMEEGKVNANSNDLYLVPTATASLLSGTSGDFEDSYFFGGTFSRGVAAGIGYEFPLGSSLDLQLLNLEADGSFDLNGPIDVLTVSFTDNIGSPTYNNNLDGGSGDFYADLLDGGKWGVTPSGPVTAGTYTIDLGLRGSTNTSPGGDYRVMKADLPGDPFELQGTFVFSAQTPQTATAVESGLASFSEFGIGQNVGTTFPVELIAFTGERQGEAVQLDWSTANEYNSDFFIVSRSMDGADFEEIARMDAKGFSQKSSAYQLLDEKPATGLNYYQLQQVDLDGTMYNLGTVAVLMGLGDQLGLQRVFPNPTTGMVTFQFELPADLNATLNLYTPQGQLVSQQSRAGQAGVNVWEVSVEDLSAGFYLYELKANGQSVRGKLQKQ